INLKILFVRLFSLSGVEIISATKQYYLVSHLRYLIPIGCAMILYLSPNATTGLLLSRRFIRRLFSKLITAMSWSTTCRILYLLIVLLKHQVLSPKFLIL